MKGSQVIDGTGEDKTITTWVLNPGLLAVDGNEHHESWRREYSRTSKSQRKWQQSTGYGRQRHIISVRVAFSKQGTRVKIPLVEQAIQAEYKEAKLRHIYCQIAQRQSSRLLTGRLWVRIPLWQPMALCHRALGQTWV